MAEKGTNCLNNFASPAKSFFDIQETRASLNISFLIKWRESRLEYGRFN